MTELPTYDFPTLSGPPRVQAHERRRRVVFVASPNPHPLELIGPMNAFAMANFVLENSGFGDFGYEVEVVASSAGVIFDHGGLEIAARKPYDQLRGGVDTLLFTPMDFEDVFDRKDGFFSWVARMAERVRRVGSICSGAYILAEAGVLSERRATTHWDLERDFRKRYPDVALDIDAIYVKDGSIYSSAGMSSGIDLTLALVEEDLGREVALRAAQGLVLFLKRPAGQSQFSVALSAQLPEASRFSELQSYIYEHLDADLRVESLASRVGMSARNFARVFAREFGVAPGRFVEQCRVEVARQRLEMSNNPLSEIACACGYETTDGMRLAFERNLGVTPRAYRQRFSTARTAG